MLPVLHTFIEIRRRFGNPIIITSGFRTRRHQALLVEQGHSTAKGESPHCYGTALDVDPGNAQDVDTIVALLKWVPGTLGLPCPRIGWRVYRKLRQHFVHFDYAFMLYGHWPGAEFDAGANPNPADWREGVEW
jgi:hypothetical protein